jgi:hypothetical protein
MDQRCRYYKINILCTFFPLFIKLDEMASYVSPSIKKTVIEARNQSNFDRLNVCDLYVMEISMKIVFTQAELCNHVM